MAIIIGVLKEELQNSLRIIARYRQEIESLPKGSVVQKEIKARKYDYLVFRKNGKVVLKYMGKLSPKEKAVYRQAGKKRRQYLKLLKDLKKQVKFIKHALHERKRRSV
ncbi:MAG: hypothetical protein HY747_02155 [Elusimicrobia bacterium]|nr:hypothetical protein [Elusimicrobiota bacterium]